MKKTVAPSPLQAVFLQGVAKGQDVSIHGHDSPILNEALSSLQGHISQLAGCSLQVVGKPTKNVSSDGGAESTKITVNVVYQNKAIARFNLFERKHNPTCHDPFASFVTFPCQIGGFNFQSRQTCNKYRSIRGGLYEELHSTTETKNIKDGATIRALGKLVSFAVAEEKERAAKPFYRRLFG